ncbi:cell division protein FtsB [Salinisphaera sp. USBA-960]|uniref:FtsB family cell division protein n=1 Tax=Salinisphaera orenii TaxID=856731 RepID=UPI000DBE2578|nr:cell division protein FtsB [Salifodinibacter halophilus]NNC26198.1 cell division protein FtsB [Salifodinibacter halophilus]
MGRIILIVLVVVLAGLQYRLWIGEGSLGQVQRLQNRLDRIQASNKQQRADNQQLAARIRDLKNGTAGVARLARHEMGMVGKNETFFLTADKADGRNTELAQDDQK